MSFSAARIFDDSNDSDVALDSYLADSTVGQCADSFSRTSDAPTMSIGQVVEKISAQFPSVQSSKLRYMEEQGIICPSRAANGYRRYSQRDVEKIRYALARQRDSYMPWSKIRTEIEILERGGAVPEPEPTARIVASRGVRTLPTPQKRLTTRELLDYSGATRQQLEQLRGADIITPDLSGRFSARALPIVVAYLALEAEGLQVRNLRAIRSATYAAIDRIEQVVALTLARGSSADRERARAQATNIAEQMNTLITELLMIGVENIT